MSTRVYVVSDLHLGRHGSAQAATRLVALLNHIASEAAIGTSTELVVAGNLLDLVAVEDPTPATQWSAFTDDENAVLTKLDTILALHTSVCDALSASLRAGCKLTIMLGDRDLELSFPEARRRLQERLGPDSFEFLVDGEAYVNGRLLVEHGSRYDRWNAVDYEGLRRVRADLSRGLPTETFTASAGSQLAASVVHPLARQYPWIYALTDAATAESLPILAVLAHSSQRVAISNMVAARRDGRRPFERIPPTGRTPPWKEDAAPDDDDPDEEDILDWIDKYFQNNSSPPPVGRSSLIEDGLVAALRRDAQADPRPHAIETENNRYLEAAKSLARNDHSVVVFGHTHRVKRVHLENDALYLNAGTWGNVARLPDAILGENADGARRAVASLLDDPQTEEIERWSQLLPTFARIDLDQSGAVIHADVYLFGSNGEISSVRTDEVQASGGE